ncbi:conserved hypothetical protein [Neospora caninum Liverpool]|uniref:Uncharacterized protein n=1 Tax=Neospora caninum (strain Liverpool) TaxID=572307 RepID=F0V853_NEOCL|nr:conserved hypothetical protein [Neospora caninum Liverpool]CBZ49894.1 conserved hypothetical protein [Neospora caninum Liverpool]|eukprot:XP_003879929.1 conserved hypothetical protein [Neospora caninum Liverpool]
MTMAWMLKGEYDFLVSSLAERLDIAKCRGLLSSSLDMRLVYSRDPTFVHYYGTGKAYLGRYIEKHLNKTGLGLQSTFMHKSLGASIVDDCNLAHIFHVLRVEELLEANSQCLPVTAAASIIIAIVGELDAMRMGLLNMQKDVRELDNFRRDSAKFLTNVLQTLVEFIVESGRDRFTYIKEALLLPTTTPPRPIPSLGQLPPSNSQQVVSDIASSGNAFSLAARLAQDDGNAQDFGGGREYLTSLYALYRRGDLQLETLLNSGSIVSIWRRLKALFDLPRATAQDLIRWAVIRQAPRLNSPFLVTVLRAGVKAWCYENELQKIDIVRGAGVGELSKKIASMICVRVDRGFIDLPMDEDIFDDDTLDKWFAPYRSEAFAHTGRYSRLNVTDNNLYRLVPTKYGTATMKQVAIVVMVCGLHGHSGMESRLFLV